MEKAVSNRERTEELKYLIKILLAMIDERETLEEIYLFMNRIFGRD